MTDGIINDLRVAMLGTTDGDFINPDSEIPAGEMFRLAAEFIEDRLRGIEQSYPTDVWHPVSGHDMAALHDFARTRGMEDGSRYHVGGIRHALHLMRGTERGIPTPN